MCPAAPKPAPAAPLAATPAATAAPDKAGTDGARDAVSGSEDPAWDAADEAGRALCSVAAEDAEDAEEEDAWLSAGPAAGEAEPPPPAFFCQRSVGGLTEAAADEEAAEAEFPLPLMLISMTLWVEVGGRTSGTSKQIQRYRLSSRVSPSQ